MKRILRQGKVGMYRMTCPSCECDFEFTIDEVLNNRVQCPNCGLDITFPKNETPYRYASIVDLSQFPDATVVHDKEEYLGTEKA